MAATNPALVIRIATKLDDLKRNLAEGKNQIEALGPAVEKLSASFNGERLKQYAQNVVAAVDKIGGATKLTEAEQARVNSTVERALEKYRVLGQTAPPGMQALADATRQVEQPTTLLNTAMGKLVGLVTAGAILKWTADLFAAAGRLQDLKERTRVSTDELQRFDLLAQQAGTNIETVANAIFQMGRRIAGGDQNAEEAIRTLGLRFADIRTMKPEDAFRLIGQAIADVADPMAQADLGAKIFGRSVGELLPLFKGLKDETGPYVTLTSQQIAALDALGDSYERVKASLVPTIVSWIDGKFQLSALLTVLQGFSDETKNLPAVQGAAAESAKKWTAAMAARMNLDVVDGITRERDIISELDREMARIKRSTEEAAKAKKELFDRLRDLEGRLDPARFKIVDLGIALKDVGVLMREDVDPAFLAAIKRFEELKQVDLSQVGRRVRPDIEQPFLDVLATLDKIETRFPDIGKAIQDVGLVGKPSMDDLQGKVVDLSDVLGDLSQDFVDLAQIGGEQFGAVARNIGLAVKAAEQLVGAFEATQTAARSGFNPGNVAAMATSWVGVATAIFSVVSGLEDALSVSLDMVGGMMRAAGSAEEFTRRWNAAAENVEKTNSLFRSRARQNADYLKRVVEEAERQQKEAERLAQMLTDGIARFGEAGALADKKFMALIARMRETGENVDTINDFFRQMGKNAIEGFNAIIAGSGKSAAELDALGTQALQVFNAARASGLSFTAALRSMGPGIATLRTGFEAVGISTENAALKTLLLANNILSTNPQLIAAVEGLVAQSTALFNVGALNAETFAAMQETGAAMFTQLQAAAAAAGGDTKDALLPMQEWLRKAQEEAERLNLPLDAMTQQMIDQSKELKIWQDLGPSAQEEMAAKTQTVIEKLEGVTTILDTLVKTDPLSKTAESGEKVNTALSATIAWLNQIPSELPDPFRNWQPPATGGPSDVSGGWRGGVVTDDGIQRLAAGAANVRARVLTFRPRGSDTVPAMLTPGESVLTVGATRALGTSTIAYLNRGGDLGRAALTGGPITIEIKAWDAKSVDEWLKRGGARKVADAIISELPSAQRRRGIVGVA